MSDRIHRSLKMYQQLELDLVLLRDKFHTFRDECKAGTYDPEFALYTLSVFQKQLDFLDVRLAMVKEYQD